MNYAVMSCSDEPVVNKLKKLRVNKADFEQRKVIGRGHFGEVHLVKEIQTGDVYAMKVMKKSTTLAKHNVSVHFQTHYCKQLTLIFCLARLHFMKKKRILWPRLNQNGLLLCIALFKTKKTCI